MELFLDIKNQLDKKNMIQSGSYLNIIDNSGAKQIACIKVPKGYRRKYASIGDVITASIKSLRKKNRFLSKVKKGDVVKAVIFHTKSISSTKQHEYYKFARNNAVLINKQNKPIGTRLFGALPKKISFTRFFRLASLVPGSLS